MRGGVSSPEVLKVLNWLKEQIVGMQSGATWKEIASTSQNGAWTISGCTPGKPLLLILQHKTATRGYLYVSAISGVVNGDIGASGASLYLLGGSGNNVSSNAVAFIPSSSTVAINVSSVNGQVELHAYA